MPFEVIPVMDLRGGKVLRLQRGASGAEARVADDPVKVARQFADAGAARLHVVDLDGVRVGTPQNVPAVRDILRRVSIPVQVGGGLRTRELAERVLNQGADRIVLSTSDVARDDAFLLDMLARYGEKIVVGADSRNGFVAAEGFTARVAESIDAFGRRLAQAGARRFLFADAAREDGVHGANIEATLAFAQAVAAGGARVLASGVVGPADVEKLAALQPHGIEGVIIGKALYGGALTLDDAVRIAAEKGGGAAAA